MFQPSKKEKNAGAPDIRDQGVWFGPDEPDGADRQAADPTVFVVFLRPGIASFFNGSPESSNVLRSPALSSRVGLSHNLQAAAWLLFGGETFRWIEHPARTARGVEDAPVVGIGDLGEAQDDQAEESARTGPLESVSAKRSAITDCSAASERRISIAASSVSSVKGEHQVIGEIFVSQSYRQDRSGPSEQCDPRSDCDRDAAEEMTGAGYDCSNEGGLPTAGDDEATDRPRGGDGGT